MSRVHLAIAAVLAVGLLVWLLASLDGQAPLDPGGPDAGPQKQVDAPPPAPMPPRAPDERPVPVTAAGAETPGGIASGPSVPGAVAADGERPSHAEPKDPGEMPWSELLSSGVVTVELAGELAGADLSAMVFPAEKKDEVAPVEAKVLDDGRVMLPPLEKGDWVLEVAAEKKGRVVRKQRRLTVGKGPVTTDPIQILPDAGIRARAVDADGAWIPQATVVVVREDEEPEAARRLTPGAGGWVLYGDLEPANYHRVVALGLPKRIEETVRTPNREGEVVEVELKADDRLVLSRVTLRLPEGAPAGGLEIEGPIPASLRPGDGEWQGLLLPGTYRLTASIRGHAGKWGGDLFVPAGGHYEGTVDLVADE